MSEEETPDARATVKVVEDLRQAAKDADAWSANVILNAATIIEDIEEGMVQGWRFLEREDDAYPPKAFLFRGGLYRYVLED